MAPAPRRGAADQGPGERRRRQGRLPRVRRDAAWPEDHVRARGRGHDDLPVPRGEGAGVPTLSRPPPAASLRGHRPGEVRGLLAVRGRLPRGLHSRRRRGEHAGEPRVRRRALRRCLRDQPQPLHLLRLLRGRVPVRRDHDGPRLRDERLRPLRPDLHQGDAAGRAPGAHAAARRGRIACRRDDMAEVLFFIAGIGAIAGAIGVVKVANPFYSVLALVFHLLSLAALFLLLRAQFVAAAQVVVYAGAVMVLYVFVVAYVGGTQMPVRPAGGPGLQAGAIIFATALFIELVIAFLGSGLQAIDSHGAQYDPGFGTPGQIGGLLLTRFLLPFEVASFLLLIAAVGAVVLARRRGGIVDQVPGTPLDRPRPLGTGTMAEAVGFLLPEGSGLKEDEPEREKGGW